MIDVSVNWLGLEFGRYLAELPTNTISATETVQSPQWSVRLIDRRGLLDPSSPTGCLSGIRWRGEWLKITAAGETISEGSVVDGQYTPGALTLTIQGALSEYWNTELDATITGYDPATTALMLLRSRDSQGKRIVPESKIDVSGFNRAAGIYQRAGVTCAVYGAADYHVKLSQALASLAGMGAARVWTDGRIHWWLPAPMAGEVATELKPHDILDIPAGSGTGPESVFNDFSITYSGTTVPATDTTGVCAALRGDAAVRTWSADYGAGANCQLLSGASEVGLMKVRKMVLPRRRQALTVWRDNPLQIGEPIRIAWSGLDLIKWTPVQITPGLNTKKVTLEEVLY